MKICEIKMHILIITKKRRCLKIIWMNLMIQSKVIRNVVELMISEYKNAEKPDFIDWNLEEEFDNDQEEQ